MLLTITTTHFPASDLGYLLEKHPGKVQTFDLAVGKATVFYPEATDERCTAALVLDVDPIGLVRNKSSSSPQLDQYVNDRPYVASSMLSVALGTVFRSALGGRSRHRPELAQTPVPLEAKVAVLPSRGGEIVLRSIFEPLGYDVELQQLPLDGEFPEWGSSRYFTLTLRGTKTLRELLQHLYVLIPVLDDEKHYWVSDAEVEKLLRHAGEWLAEHPRREQIAHRYLKHRRSLAREAIARLTAEEEEDADVGEDVIPAAQPPLEERLEQKSSLYQLRIDAVESALEELGSKTLVDMGCGEGRFLAALIKLKQLERVVGMDVSVRSLERARDRLHFDRMSPRQRERVDLMHGSLIYRDDRLRGFDVATVIEVIEHLDVARLAAFERVLFEFARPQAILLTTPNSEYNVRYELEPGQFRHSDHRFEWTRAEFQAWCEARASRFGYSLRIRPVGEQDPDLGAPTQMAVFELGGAGLESTQTAA